MENYKILTIAPSGAGKTVFLASMFKQLSTQGEYQFFLQVEDAKQRGDLNNIYTEIATGEKWPPGTRGDVTRWVFNCCVKDTNLDKYPVCQFTYFDYKGGLITNPEPGDFDFGTQVKNMDAVLAILDGTKLLALIENKDVSRWLFQELPNLAQIIEECHDIPVHLIISKWDVLHDKNYDLKYLWECIAEKCHELKHVVETRKKRQPVRLIPVSSIGMEFATLQPDGSMEKIPGQNPKPYQLEIPITYAMTDSLEKELERVITQLEQQNQENSNFFTKILNFVDNVPFINLLSGPLAQLYSIIQGDNYTVNLDEVRDQETALIHAIKSFKNIQQDFEQKFPHSNLDN